MARITTGWYGEIPTRIHGRGIDGNGAPEWSPAFLAWISKEAKAKRSPDETLRVKRAMRMLRREAPREYEVVYRAILGETIEQIAQWLNDRAIRGGHPERYSLKDAVFLLISGVDKVSLWM